MVTGCKRAGASIESRTAWVDKTHANSLTACRRAFNYDIKLSLESLTPADLLRVHGDTTD